jgi:hypothetical protein
MREDIVENSEKLFRAIKPPPQFWSTKENRPSSALFKDTHGVSVDRNGEREQDDVNSFFKSRFENLRGLALIYASTCLEVNCRVFPKQEDGNPFHAHIEGETELELKNSQARHIAKNCSFIEF